MTAYEMRISEWSSDVCSSDLALADEHLDGRVDARGEAVLVPGQEQLALQERIHRAPDVEQVAPCHAPVVLEAAGDPRRRGEQVQNVVAEVAQQHRGVRVGQDRKSTRLNSRH